MPKKKKRGLADIGSIYEQSDRAGYVISWKDRQGRRRRRTVKGELSAAQLALSEEQKKVEQARLFGRDLPSEDSFEAWADEFLRIQEERISPTVKKNRLSLAEFKRIEGIVNSHLKPSRAFKGKKLASITRADVISYIHSRTGEVSDGTLIKEVGVIKRLFYLALDKDKIIATPAHTLRKHMPVEPEGRKRWLVEDEILKVLKAAPDWLKPIIGLAVTLGPRRGELLAVKIPDIDLENGTILLRRTKNGRERVLYLNADAWMVINALDVAGRKRRKERGLLFPDVTPAQVSVEFIRAAKRAGIVKDEGTPSFHDLRHSYAYLLRRKGGKLEDIGHSMGHTKSSTMRMTLRYAHIGEEQERNVSQLINGVLTLPAPEVEQGTEPQGQ
jgi:integrase